MLSIRGIWRGRQFLDHFAQEGRGPVRYQHENEAVLTFPDSFAVPCTWYVRKWSKCQRQLRSMILYETRRGFVCFKMPLLSRRRIVSCWVWRVSRSHHACALCLCRWVFLSRPNSRWCRYVRVGPFWPGVLCSGRCNSAIGTGSVELAHFYLSRRFGCYWFTYLVHTPVRCCCCCCCCCCVLSLLLLLLLCVVVCCRCCCCCSSHPNSLTKESVVTLLGVLIQQLPL